MLFFFIRTDSVSDIFSPAFSRSQNGMVHYFSEAMAGWNVLAIRCRFIIALAAYIGIEPVYSIVLILLTVLPPSSPEKLGWGHQ